MISVMSEDEAVLWVVAGCLFEVALPVTPAGRWRWANPGDDVSLLADDVRQGRQHLRFRAEASGARAGRVELRFACGEAGGRRSVLRVRIAPERLS